MTECDIVEVIGNFRIGLCGDMFFMHGIHKYDIFQGVGTVISRKTVSG